MKIARRLIAGGITLRAAIDHLDSLPAKDVARQLDSLPDAGLAGDEIFFFYAPTVAKDIAKGIAQRIKDNTPERAPPALAHIYVLALQQLACADRQALSNVCDRLLEE
jgi:hypothetical protein